MKVVVFFFQKLTESLTVCIIIKKCMKRMVFRALEGTTIHSSYPIIASNINIEVSLFVQFLLWRENFKQRRTYNA